MNVSNVDIDRVVDYKSEYSGYLKKIKAIGTDQIVSCCIFHKDKNPSLTVNLKTGQYECFGCGEKGNFITFYAKIHGLSTKDAYKEILQKYGMADEEWQSRAQDPVKEYARMKGLPEEWLREKFKLSSEHTSDGAQYMRIPYMDECGREIATRKRFMPKDFRWDKGSKVMIYGMWNLQHILNKGYVILVEGESDCQTCLLMDHLALGCPGASCFKPEFVKKLQGVKVYIHVEPDKGGQTFLTKVTKLLYEEGYGGDVYQISCSQYGVKDPSDLYLRDGKEEASRKIQSMLHNAEQINLATFGSSIEDRMPEWHRYDKNGNPISVVDAKLVADIIAEKKVYVVNSIPYYLTNGLLQLDKNGDLVKDEISKRIYEDVRTAKRINEIFRLLISTKEIRKLHEELNNYQDTAINFKNGFLDLVTSEFVPHSNVVDGTALALNQIEYEYDPSAKISDEIWNFFNEWIPQKDDRTMLWEFIGICMTRFTGFQKFLIFLGPGGTGKSSLINLISKIVGKSNISNVSLQDLNQRFYPASIIGKLLNACADISSEAMKQVDNLKKITGEDSLLIEMKTKDPYFAKSYAKLIFSANYLPVQTDEQTGAFFRRLLILKISEKGPYISNFEKKLEESIPGIIAYSCKLAGEALRKRMLTESYQSKKEVMLYRAQCDTVQAYFDEKIVMDSDGRIDQKVLYQEYVQYCEQEGRTPLTINGFYKNIRGKGFLDQKSGNSRYFRGLSFKENEFEVIQQGEFPF